MAERPVIEMHDVQLSLGNGPARVHILQGVSLNVARGEALGLVGSSGSGKSTLLMTIAGLEKPDSGSVTVDGKRIDQMNEDALARFRGARIGVIFQTFHLIPTMTALENVAVPLEKARLTHRPAQLSGGEQQRVAIARALAPDPAILVADEPTGNLDETTGKTIIDLLFALRKARGSTLVLVTHDLALARLCDRTIRLKSGKIVDSEFIPAVAGDAA